MDARLEATSILLIGLFWVFYRGRVDVSKSFLDPFGNEGYPGQNVRVDVLVSELNFGAGSRWVRAGAGGPGQVPGAKAQNGPL